MASFEQNPGTHPGTRDFPRFDAVPACAVGFGMDSPIFPRVFEISGSCRQAKRKDVRSMEGLRRAFDAGSRLRTCVLSSSDNEGKKQFGNEVSEPNGGWLW